MRAVLYLFKLPALAGTQLEQGWRHHCHMVCRRCCTARTGAQTPREGDHGAVASASAKTEPGFFISPPTSLNLAISQKTLRAAQAPFILLVQQGGASYPEPCYCIVSVPCWLSLPYIILEISSGLRARKNSGKKALCYNS